MVVYAKTDFPARKALGKEALRRGIDGDDKRMLISLRREIGRKVGHKSVGNLGVAVKKSRFTRPAQRAAKRSGGAERVTVRFFMRQEKNIILREKQIGRFTDAAAVHLRPHHGEYSGFPAPD